MNLRDLFVEDPIKKESAKRENRIEGTFRCMDCGHDCDYASQIEDRLTWLCDECGYSSSMKSIF